MTQIVERGTLLKVLDHGYVKIIDFMGKDENIVEAARMSTARGFISWDPYERCKACGCCWRRWDHTVPGDNKPSYSLIPGHKSCELCENDTPANTEKFPNGDVGLMDTLYRKKHATPFEMGELVIEVQAPIFVFREWHRHRTQSYNEFSARYALMPNLHYLPEKSRIQRQSAANKQGSAEVMGDDFAVQVLAELERQQGEIFDSYDSWADSGLAKEVARINTPVSRYSKMRAKGNLRNWFQFLNLRMRPDAQNEIRQYAEEVSKMIGWLWPKAHALFEEYDLYGAHLSRTELRALRVMLTTKYNVFEAAKSVGLSGTKLKDFQTKLEFGGEKIL